MKNKRFLSLFCSAAMLFSIASAPIGQASAYTVDVQEISDPATDMPAEVKERCKEGRNHVFDMSAYYSKEHGVDVDKMYSDEFEHNLIMPGDTFEFPIFVSENSTIFYMGQAQIGKDDKTVPGYHSVQDYYVKSSDLVDYGYYEYSGEITPLKIETRTFTDGKYSSTCRFCTKYKNNTDCPLYIISGGGGSGPVAGKYTYAHGNINIYLLAPHYDLYYAQQPISDGNPKPGDTAKLEQFFWRQGQLSDFTFPKYYWITDEPYTFTLPNPTAAGKHFLKWEKSKSAEFPGREQSEDYTTFTVKFNYADLNSWENGLGGIGYASISPCFVEGSTITFNGRGGTIKGYDQYIAEVSDYNEEPEEFGYALEDYAPVKDGDTFVGWCSKEDAYYDSFVTKDDESAVYQKFSTGWNKTNNIVLYAKWASETEEALEKNGWEITDDGTLWLLDNQGTYAWKKAREADPTLCKKVKSIKLGFRDKTVTAIPDGCFSNCVNLTDVTFDDTVYSFGSWCFEGCSKLKTATFGKGVSVGYGAFRYCTSLEKVIFEHAPSHVSQAFFYAPFDLLVTVADGDTEGFVTALGSYSGNTNYAYLLNDEERYPLTVNGELITENNLTVKCGDGTATFDPESNTLTLNNAELTSTLTPHSDISSFNGSGVISMLPNLNIVVKGTLKTVDLETVNAKDDLNITGMGENASLKPVSSDSVKSSAIIRSTGKLSINNMTAATLNAYGDEVIINNSVLNGGLSPFSSKTSTIVIKDSTIKQDEDDKGTYTPSISAANVTVENSTLDNVDFSIGTRCEAITIKDSTVKLNSWINAKADSKLNIINSTINGKGIVGHGVTNISEENITLTDCEITKGGWKKALEFEILPSSQVSGDTEYKAGPSIDSWYKSVGGDYTVVINRKDDGYIVGTFKKLTMGGNDVDTQNYTYVNAGDGFKQVVLKEAYLNTLTNNVFSFEALFSDGTAKFDVAVCYEIDYSPSVTDENCSQSSGKDFIAAIYRDPADGSDFSSLLKDVAVDGKTIDSKNYSVSMNDSASVNIVLKADYLKTLSEGKHTVLAVFADGKAEYSVVVKKDGTASDPDTDKPTPIDTDTDKPTPIDTDTDKPTPIDTDTDKPTPIDTDTDKPT
ncbi:MAG: leucine-rich repeat protein, partial [Clostridia bacterium]|nr:leucine-rich repeat protein [Clostridia bacterium]